MTNVTVADPEEHLGLPGWVSSNACFFAAERERVLAPSWQVICHSNDIPRAGDYHTFEFIGESIVVVRAAATVCRAPSAMSACTAPPGWSTAPPASAGRRNPTETEMLECVSAITLATHDMARAVAFYRALGFELKFGGPGSPFTSFHAGSGYLNLTAAPAERTWSWWGRAIFYVDDVDAQHARALAAGLSPDFAPRNAAWGKRYFHIGDPDGHELSFAQPLCGERWHA